MLTKIIPSYLYWQYNDDEDLQSFVTAYNGLAQQYLDSVNALDMPIYTVQSGALLDWFATGIYGYPRPVVQTGVFVNVGAYNTIPYDPLVVPYNANETTNNGTGYQLSDDEYKRYLTWCFYKGDGFVFNITWLKRRIKRFIQGVNGFAPAIDKTYEISVTFSSAYHVLITINNTFADGDMIALIQEGISSGFLYLPFQYTYTVVSS